VGGIENVSSARNVVEKKIDVKNMVEKVDLKKMITFKSL
jgi:hypothetical protein